VKTSKEKNSSRHVIKKNKKDEKTGHIFSIYTEEISLRMLAKKLNLTT